MKRFGTGKVLQTASNRKEIGNSRSCPNTACPTGCEDVCSNPTTKPKEAGDVKARKSGR